MNKPCCNGQIPPQDKNRFFLHLPGLGWNVASGEMPEPDMAALAGAGLGLDQSGRLFVNWNLLPESLVLAVLADHLGPGLEFENGLLAASAAKVELPESFLNEMDDLAARLALAENAIADNAGKAASAKSLAENAKNAADAAGAGVEDAQNAILANAARLDLAENAIAETGSLAETAQAAAQSAGENAALAQATAGNAASAAANAQADANDAKSMAEANAAALAGKADKTLATQEASGLMSSGDKAKLDGVEAGAQVNPTLAELGGVAKAGGTMTGVLTIDANNWQPLNLKAHNMDRTLIPDSWRGLQARFLDKNGEALGVVEAVLESSGRHRMDLVCIGASDDIKNYLQVMIEADGTPLVGHPTPPMSTTSTGISATTGYVNGKLGAGASVAALAMLDEDVDGYVETLEVKKLKAIAQVNAEAQQAIYSGFSYEIDGEEYFISYSLFDQQNLSDLAIAALGDPAGRYSLPCMNDEGQRVFPKLGAATIRDLHRFALVDFKLAILQAADDKKARIMAAADEAEIHGIVKE